MYQQLIDYIRDKEILLLGFSREGHSTYNFIRRHLPDKHLSIADMREIEIEDENVTLFCGEGYLDAIENAACVLDLLRLEGRRECPCSTFRSPTGWR